MTNTLRVLAVDDDPLFRQVIAHKLEQRGYVICTVEDAPTALTTLADFRPDVVVVDMMMPGMDGFALLAALKDREDSRDIPVVILSARKQEEDIVRALQLGAADYLVKPFSADELSVRLSRFVQAAG